MGLPIYVPLLYISVLVGSLILFSRWHRSRKEAAIATTEPWFPTHKSRDLYISLLNKSQEGPVTDIPTDSSSPSATEIPIPEKMLMSALLLRAQEDVHRIHRIRESKLALTALIQTGSLGEETQARFTAAEKEMEAEVVDVVSEANAYRQGWGQWIFASASEMVAREKIRDVLGNVDKVREEQERKYKLINPNFKTTLIAPPPGSNPTAILPGVGPQPTSTSAPMSMTMSNSGSGPQIQLPTQPLQPGQQIFMNGPNGQRIPITPEMFAKLQQSQQLHQQAQAQAKAEAQAKAQANGSAKGDSGTGTPEVGSEKGEGDDSVGGSGPSTPAKAGGSGSAKTTPASGKKKGKRR